MSLKLSYLLKVCCAGSRQLAHFKVSPAEIFQTSKLDHARPPMAMLRGASSAHFQILFWVVVASVTNDVSAQELRQTYLGIKKVQESFDSVRNFDAVQEAAKNTAGALRPDSIDQMVAALEYSARQRIDSLVDLGFSPDSLHARLRNMLNSPNKVDSLLAFHKGLNIDINQHAPLIDTLMRLQTVLKEKASGFHAHFAGTFFFNPLPPSFQYDEVRKTRSR